MTAKITINMDNAAFEEAGNGMELARILHKLAVRVEDWELKIGEGHSNSMPLDINGNMVGSFELTE